MRERLTVTGWAMNALAVQVGLGVLWASVAFAAQGKAEHVPTSPADQAEPKLSDLAPPQQGPAIGVPQEILAMLDQRKQALDKKEETLRLSEARLQSMKSEIEEILARHEQSLKLAEKARKTAEEEKAAAAGRQRTVDAETIKADQVRLAKIYETMPAEEAAARIEKMPSVKALAVLRLLKGKTAGAILAQVSPAKAAKLTEQLIPKQQ